MGKEKLKEGEDCAIKCDKTDGCTHYSSVNDYCFKKNGSVSQSDAVFKNGIVCGILNETLSVKGFSFFFF